ncbi:MAG: hypothetical protein IJS52_03040 [Bacilli bacterium]|nr:hypothetical protein [Bacilli bacterium]
MANTKKNGALEDASPAIGEEINPITGEVDDMSDLLPKAEGISPVAIATKEEIAKCPDVTVELTANTLINRSTKVTRHDYTAVILFSYLTKFTIHLEDAEYGLICEELGKDYARAQFRYPAKARIVGTALEDGRILYRLDAFLSESVRKTFPLDPDGAFIKLFLSQVKSGKIKGCDPEIRKAATK